MSRSTEAIVRALVDDAEEARDWTDDIVAQADVDPGAPFKPENLEQLAKLQTADSASFETLRARLRNIGVRVSKLDEQLKRLSRRSADLPAGRRLDLPELEPWHEPVDGAALLDEVTAAIREYLVVGEYAAEAMALWAMHAHAHDAALISPRLSFSSPDKRCGKTTALLVLYQLVPRALLASNITAAAVFRAVEAAKPTLLIDEADTYLKDNDELRCILNSGHNRAASFVVKSVGDDHQPANFSTWAPAAIAMIGPLPDTLADRAIQIEMRRKRPTDAVHRFRLDRTERLAVLGRKLARWASDHDAALREWDGDVPASLHDRAADNWRPLLSIADTAGGDWPTKARTTAMVLSKSTADDQSFGVLLLRDIQGIFEVAGSDRMPSVDILGRLNAMDDRPWPEWRRGNPMTARQLAQLLKPFGINPGSIRLKHGALPKGYQLAWFEDAFARYASPSATPPQGAESLGFSAEIAATRRTTVAHEKPPDLAESIDCGGVAGESSEGWEDVL